MTEATTADKIRHRFVRWNKDAEEFYNTSFNCCYCLKRM